MPKPVRKPWSRKHVDSRLVLGEVEHGDLRRLGILDRGRRPLADQLTGSEVVGGERGVGGVDRFEWRVEGDHHEAGVAGLLDGRHDGDRVAGGDHESGGPGGDEVFDGRDLGIVVAVELAGERAQLDAELIGFRLGAFAHLDEERVGFCLGDQPDDRSLAGRGGVAGRACRRTG